MSTNRRGFLGLLLAAAASPAIVRAESLMKLAVPPRLVLWGDGIHDDAAALQALIDGKDVVRRDGSTFIRSEHGGIFLAHGCYALGSPIVLDANVPNALEHCWFTSYQGIKLPHLLEFRT